MSDCPAALAAFNAGSAAQARQDLLACCSCAAWADRMMAARPYRCADDAVRQSDAALDCLTTTDLAEALAGHPRIGEDPAASHPARSAAWSRREQSGLGQAGSLTVSALAAAGRQYEQRFGHIYLVCAAGRTGPELLAILERRLRNDAETEWQVVRSELRKINEIRLRSLLAGPQ
jgi:2-oxo-4-hydroxy-4-carboxy-5-ureidoimidazoline decarboxylase